MRKLGLKQDLGAFLQEKLSFQGFSAKTRDLYIINSWIQGLAHKNARAGLRALFPESSGAKTLKIGPNRNFF